MLCSTKDNSTVCQEEYWKQNEYDVKKKKKNIIIKRFNGAVDSLNLYNTRIKCLNKT